MAKEIGSGDNKVIIKTRIGDKRVNLKQKLVYIVLSICIKVSSQ